MKEIWKDIEGYEGYYQISNYGRVKSLERYKSNYSKLQLVPERILSQGTKENGYKVIILYKDNKGKNNYIHRLVAQAFLPNPNDLATVNHKDGNKANNHLSNLEWASYAENNRHARLTGLSKPRGKEIEIVYENGETKKFPSISKCAREIGCHRDTIYNFLEGLRSTLLAEMGVLQIII